MNLDDIMKQRQSIRKFSEEIVENKDLEKIIEAGRQAPYAGLVQGSFKSFRHFFVLPRNHSMCEAIMDLVAQARLKDLEEVNTCHLEEKYPVYANVVKGMSGKKPMDLFMAPILVIVAERAGMPARESVVLGHVLQNMWLKATEMGIGLKLCSGIGDIKDKDTLKKLLGLSEEEDYAFDACNLGYAAEDVWRNDVRSVPETSITYL